MRKTYRYKDALYKRKVKFVGAYCGVIGLFAAISLLWNQNFLLFAVIIVCFYTYWETYVSLANPQEVIADKDTITFTGCGMTHTYKWKDIKIFQLKEFPSANRVFLRINHTTMKKGRYWINYGNFSDGKELYHFLRDKEYEIQPGSLKAHARRSSEAKFLERQKQAELKAQQEEAKRLEKARLKAAKKAKNNQEK